MQQVRLGFSRRRPPHPPASPAQAYLAYRTVRYEYSTELVRVATPGLVPYSYSYCSDYTVV